MTLEAVRCAFCRAERTDRQTHQGRGVAVERQVLQGLECGEQKSWSIYPVIRALAQSTTSLGMKVIKRPLGCWKEAENRSWEIWAVVG